MTDGRHDSAPSDTGDVPWRGTALRDLASALPTVASALEDFIARANQTERAVVAWEADPAAGAAGAQAAAELRDAAAREQVLQRQLDELQAKLAKAEARAAANEAAPASAGTPAVAARAIEQRVAAAPRTRPWPPIAGAFVGGIVVMLVVSRLTHDAPSPASRAPVVDAQGTRSAVERAAPQPTVTPIEPPPSAAVDPAASAPKDLPPPQAAAPQPPPPTAPPRAAPVASPQAPRPPRPSPARPAAVPARPTASPADTLTNPFDAPEKPRTPPQPARPAEPKPSGQLVNPF